MNKERLKIWKPQEKPLLIDFSFISYHQVCAQNLVLSPRSQQTAPLFTFHFLHRGGSIFVRRRRVPVLGRRCHRGRRRVMVVEVTGHIHRRPRTSVVRRGKSHHTGTMAAVGVSQAAKIQVVHCGSKHRPRGGKSIDDRVTNFRTL